jgi:hypothetical protein
MEREKACIYKYSLFLMYTYIIWPASRWSSYFSQTPRTFRYGWFLCMVFSSSASIISPSDQSGPVCVPINLPLCAIKAKQRSFSLESSLWKAIIAYLERMEGSCKHLSINRCSLDTVCFSANKEAGEERDKRFSSLPLLLLCNLLKAYLK